MSLETSRICLPWTLSSGKFRFLASVYPLLTSTLDSELRFLGTQFCQVSPARSRGGLQNPSGHGNVESGHLAPGLGSETFPQPLSVTAVSLRGNRVFGSSFKRPPSVPLADWSTESWIGWATPRNVGTREGTDRTMECISEPKPALCLRWWSVRSILFG